MGTCALARGGAGSDHRRDRRVHRTVALDLHQSAARRCRLGGSPAWGDRRRNRRRDSAGGRGVPACAVRPSEAGNLRRAWPRRRSAPRFVGTRAPAHRRGGDQRNVVGAQEEEEHMSKGRGRVGTRVGRIRAWLARQTDSWVGRLSFLWFKRYMEASKNSGASTSAYFTLSVIPTALVAIAFFGEAGGNTNALAERLITHMHLTGSTADIV